MRISIKRIYADPARSDGLRILVDRVWPRGVSRDAAAIDLWLKEVAPSTELRKWFDHDPKKWVEFRKRYKAELKASPDHVQALLDHARRGPLTLVYSARDEQHNQAVVLKEYLEEKRS
jgi:uncharacterized protein YeaO (DUF488 family)